MKSKNKLLIVTVATLLVVIVAMLSLYVAKIGKDLSVQYPEGYTVLTEENAAQNEALIEKLGYGVTSFQKYLRQKGIVSLAVNEDNSRQFRLIEQTTDLTTELKDLEGVSDRELNAVAEKLLPNGYAYLVRRAGVPYFEVHTKVKNGNESYCTVQFITIKNGKYYSLNYYGSQKSLSDAERTFAISVLNTLKIPESGGLSAVITRGGTMRAVYLVILSVAVLLGVVIAVVLSVSLIRDIKKRRADDASGTFKIKRRRK